MWGKSKQTRIHETKYHIFVRFVPIFHSLTPPTLYMGLINIPAALERRLNSILQIKRVSFSSSTPLVSARRGAPLFVAASSRPNSSSFNNSAFGFSTTRKPPSLSYVLFSTEKKRCYKSLTGVYCCFGYERFLMTCVKPCAPGPCLSAVPCVE